jgi:hypothetical protein
MQPACLRAPPLSLLRPPFSTKPTHCKFVTVISHMGTRAPTSPGDIACKGQVWSALRKNQGGEGLRKEARGLLALEG